jgi:soluble lytic murein transglycosylase-like protein
MRLKRGKYPHFFKTMLIFLFVLSVSIYTYSDVLSSSKKPYDDIIVSIAQQYRVPPELVHSIIKTESSYDAWAISSKGAMG